MALPGSTSLNSLGRVHDLGRDDGCRTFGHKPSALTRFPTAVLVENIVKSLSAFAVFQGLYRSRHNL
jgi:hypothetical protein